MKKDIALKITISIITIICLILNPIITRAGFFDDIFDQADGFIGLGESQAQSGLSSSGVKSFSDEIYVILLTIGIIVAVVIGGVLGVTFILESAEGKAKIKEALIPYIVGCIVVFGAFGIWRAVVLVLN